MLGAHLMNLRKIHRRTADTLTVSARLVPLYLLGLILDWQDRKAGAR